MKRKRFYLKSLLFHATHSKEEGRYRYMRDDPALKGIWTLTSYSYCDGFIYMRLMKKKLKSGIRTITVSYDELRPDVGIWKRV